MLAKPNHRRRSVRTRLFASVAALCLSLSLCVHAVADSEGSPTEPNSTSDQAKPSPDIDPSAGLSFNLPSGSSTSLSGLDAFSSSSFDMPSLELPVEAIGSTLFKLDLSDQDCLSGAGRCAIDNNSGTFGLSKYITAKKDSGIDLVLRPRASFRFDDQSSSAAFGAVVEIGEDLRRGSDYKTNTWYLFAGADAEALTYAPDSVGRLSSGRFHLQDRIIVGDAQAGLGYRIGDADVSLSYLRREANAEGLSFNEEAAALSFTWKR